MNRRPSERSSMLKQKNRTNRPFFWIHRIAHSRPDHDVLCCFRQGVCPPRYRPPCRRLPILTEGRSHFPRNSLSIVRVSLRQWHASSGAGAGIIYPVEFRIAPMTTIALSSGARPNPCGQSGVAKLWRGQRSSECFFDTVTRMAAADRGITSSPGLEDAACATSDHPSADALYRAQAILGKEWIHSRRHRGSPVRA